MRAAAAIAIMLASGAIARADAPPAPHSPGGFRFVVDGGTMYVERGAQRARVPIGTWPVDTGFDVTDDVAGRQVTLAVGDCGAGDTRTFGYDALEARLALAAGDPARAVALDPTYREAAFGDAAALVPAGKLDDAAAVLAPWIAAAPARVFLEVADTPALAPLRRHAAIAAARAPRRGNVRFARDGSLVGGLAYSAHLRAFAILYTDGDLSGSTWTDLEVIDAATGAVMATLPAPQLTDGGPDGEPYPAAERAAVPRRGQALQAMLRDLGFSSIGHQVIRLEGWTPAAVRFRRRSLAIAIDRGAAAVTRGATTIASGDVMLEVHAAYDVASLHRVLIASGQGGSETCGPEQLHQYTVLVTP